MKAILEFNCPDEKSELQLAIDGFKWKIVVEDVDRILRNKIKYENQETIYIEEVRNMITEVIKNWELRE